MADSDDGTGRAVFDCLSAVVLMLTALLGAYLPRYLSHNGGGQSGTATSLAFHLGNMLSGGVMLSAGFCHLLADSLRQLAFIGRFPIATFLAAVGYLTTLLADQLVQVLTAEDSATSAAAGIPASSTGSRLRHEYVRLGKEDSSSGIEMIGGTQQLQVVELNGGLGASQMHYGDSISKNSMVGNQVGAARMGETGARGVASAQVMPRLQLSGLGISTAAAAADGNGLVAHSSAADDVAVCVHASGSPRALTADRVAARPCSRNAYGAVLPTAATKQQFDGHSKPCCQCQDGCTASKVSSSNGEATVATNGGPYQQQQPQQQAAVWSLEDDTQQSPQQLLLHDSCADTAGSPSLPCSQLLVTSPKQEQQHWQHLDVVANGRAQQDAYVEPQKQFPLPHGSSRTGHSRWHPGSSDLGCLDRSSKGPNSCSHTQRQQQQHLHQHHMCCLHGDSCPQHPEDMTEAWNVARVAGHLELEIQTPGAGQGAGHGHAHFQVLLSHQPLSFATTVLLACALCIHSILEGTALGAQQSMQSTRDIMLAIAAHKGLAAYALGASIVESKASTAKFWTVVSMFAVATPLGIGIGYAFSNIGNGSVSAAMSALASGTFLYVALNEVIPKELEHPDGHRLLKVVALLIGFGLMSLLAVWA